MKNKKFFTLSMVVFLGLAGTLFCGSPVKTQAEESSIATEKMRFAAEMDKKYAEEIAFRPMARSMVDLDELISKAFFAKDEEKEVLLEELSQNGIYQFETENCPHEEITEEGDLEVEENEKVEIVPAGAALYHDSGPEDVDIYAPEIYYQASDQTWVVSCGGKWKKGNALPWVSIAVTTIGDPDAFGVGYTSIKSEYNSAVLKSYAYIEDNTGSQRETTEIRSDGNGALGFGFRLQDRQFKTSTFTSYVGHIWYGACTYDKDFATYNAVATGYYSHTYSSCKVSEVSFGVQGQSAGVTVKLTNEKKGFTGYGTDTKF